MPGMPLSQFRALDIQQLNKVGAQMEKIGTELEILNSTLARIADIFDEISQAEEEPDGPAEQGPVAPTDHTG